MLCIHDVFGAHVNVTNSFKENLDVTHCRSGGPSSIDFGVQVLKPRARFG